MTLSKDSIDECAQNRVNKLFKEFFIDCPYGRKAISTCTALGKDGRTSSTDYTKQLSTECPHGKRFQTQCPYSHRSAYHNDQSHNEYAKEFFTECPYGRRAAAGCPYGRDILAKSKLNDPHTYDQTNKYIDEFFTECPYGRRAAEQCPYGHDILEKANIKIAPLPAKSDDKCPFASSASESEARCPAAHTDSTKKNVINSRCPVGGVMPQSENCPFSLHYHKKNSIPICFDLYESDTEFKFYVELPGIAKGDVKLEVKDNIITLSAEKKDALEGYVCRTTERKLGLLSRSLSLPDNASIDEIQAVMENGLLIITVPKRTPSIVKSIIIN
jgi:HSP20 family protein